MKDLILSEPLANANKLRGACQLCCLWSECESPFIKPRIPKDWTGEYLFVTEYPTEDDDAGTGKLITGEFGSLFWKIISQSGLRGIDCVFVPTVRCRPNNDSKPSMEAIRSCAPFVIRSIEYLKPKHIITFGSIALKGLLDDGSEGNVANNRGKVLPVANLPPYTFTCTYSPATCLTGAYNFVEYIVNDIKQVSEAKLSKPIVSCYLNTSGIIGFDTEFKDHKLITTGVSDGAKCHAEENGFVETRVTLHNCRTVAGHSAYVDLDHLRDLGCNRNDLLRGENLLDTFILAKMYDENRLKGSYKLENLLRSFFKVEEWKKDTELYSETDPTCWPQPLRMERCRLDAWGTAILAKTLLPLAQGPVEFTHKIAAVLHRIGLAGAYIDLPKLDKVKQEFYGLKMMAEDQLTAFAFQTGMTEFTPTNDNHIRTLLHKKLGLPVLSKTKTGKAKVDKLTLQNLSKDYPSYGSVFKRLGEFSKFDKLYTTYAVSLSNKIQQLSPTVGWLPVRINPMAARTGRRSSDSPNFQNWPKSVRGVITSRHKSGLIGDHDYNKLEIGIMAWESGDSRLMKAYLTGNIYVETAAKLFGKTVDKDSDLYRVAKSIVLGVDYNMQSYKLAHDLRDKLGVMLKPRWEDHVEEAGRLIQKYLSVYPGIKAYMLKREAELLHYGYITTATNRRRNLPCPKGRFTEGYGHLLNQAINAPIQGLASDITGSALIDVEAALLSEYKLSISDYHSMLYDKKWPDIPLIINEVHDDLVVDYPNTDRRRHKRDVELVVETMKAVPSLRKLVPKFDLVLNIEATAGSHWGVK